MWFSRNCVRPVLRSQAGLSTLEFMIAALIGLVILLASGTAYLFTDRSFKLGSQKVVAQQEATVLSYRISREIREGASFFVYDSSNRTQPVTKGNGVAILNELGVVYNRLEWDAGTERMVDENGNPVNAARIRTLEFQVDPLLPTILEFAFSTDDENGNLVDVQSSVSLLTSLPSADGPPPAHSPAPPHTLFAPGGGVGRPPGR